MHIGRKWHCVDRKCSAELIITESSRLVDVGKPRCGCGGVMKREYEKPTVRKVVTHTGKGHEGAAGNEGALG
jgi:hypothetical protein